MPPVHSSCAACTPLLILVLSPLQKNTWLVTPAAPQRPSCRRTLASISCSVKRATPAALSPASRPASRLWRAREHSSAPKPTEDLGVWAAPPLSAPHPSRAEVGDGRPRDSLKRLYESECGRVWLFLSCCGLARQVVKVKLTDRVETEEADSVYQTLLDTFALWIRTSLTY